MISAIVGSLGSGKSFYACNYLFKFVKHDDLYSEYIVDSNVLIIANIEGLKIKHWDLDECIKKHNGDLKKFFSIANFENIMKTTGKNHVILCIDEAHVLFDSKYYDKDVYEFFAYSRHIGLDIILMTQGMQSMSRMFNPLLEFIVNAVPRSKQILNNMSYKFTDLRGNYLYSKTLAKNKLVFGMYKSFRVDEKQKPKNAVLHWVVITVLFLVVAGGLFKTALAMVANKAKPENTKKQVSPSAARYAASAVPSAVPVMRPMSSVRVPVGTSLSAVALASPQQTMPVVDLPRVIGLVGDTNGKNTKYLLSSGQITTCKRSLNIGDIYIR